MPEQCMICLRSDECSLEKDFPRVLNTCKRCHEDLHRLEIELERRLREVAGALAELEDLTLEEVLEAYP